MPSSSASVFDFPDGSITNSFAFEPPNPPPPAYRSPFESRATDHRNVTDGSKISLSAGASIRRPSLARESLVRLPFSKSAIAPCSQVLVSTAGNHTAAHRTTVETRRICIGYGLLYGDPERIAAAHHVVERNRELLPGALRRPNQSAARRSLRLQDDEHGRGQTGQGL